MKNDWFVKINKALKNNVKFTDDITLSTQGIGDVSMKRKNGEHSLIKDVLYILGIKYKFLSIGQFLERNYKIHIENKVLKVIEANDSLILKAHMTQNRTFKVEQKLMEHRCLAISASREEWIWNYRLGHLNFKDLNAMQDNDMVTWISLFYMPTNVCEECGMPRNT